MDMDQKKKKQRFKQVAIISFLVLMMVVSLIGTLL